MSGARAIAVMAAMLMQVGGVRAADPAVSFERLAELQRAEKRLEAIEQLCLWVVLRPYSVVVRAQHPVAFTTLEGETPVDAAARSCAALAATLHPDQSSMSVYCASCEITTFAEEGATP